MSAISACIGSCIEDNDESPHATTLSAGMTGNDSQPLKIWRVTDLRQGHLAQSEGLCDALGRLTTTDVISIPALPRLEAIADCLWPPYGASPEYPHARSELDARGLILCCGHRTHLTGLALRRTLGGHLVVLMRPSLPLRWFDLVVAPRHDGLAASARMLQTEGVLNPLTPEGPHRPDRGLILIGGPSRHHKWDNASLIDQLRKVASATPRMRWTLTTSRRTPAATTHALVSLRVPGLDVVPMEQTGQGWVAAQLAEASSAWITEDSVSMVYEALTAGVAVGLLGVPAKASSRVIRGVEDLVAEGRVARFANWHPGSELPHRAPLAEADRVAREILRRWYPYHLCADQQS